MSIMNWFRKSSTEIPKDIPKEEETSFPELVILVNQEIPASDIFVQGAIEEVFGVKLPTEASDTSTEFITGEFPIFTFQHKERLMQLKFIPDSYFAAKARPFASGNPDHIHAQVNTRQLQKAVKRHVMWVAASAVNWNDSIPEDEAYQFISRILSAFTIGITEAIIWPKKNAVRAWEDSMQGLLDQGKAIEIFTSKLVLPQPERVGRP